MSMVCFSWIWKVVADGNGAGRKLTMRKGTAVELQDRHLAFLPVAGACQAVNLSSSARKNIACWLLSPHISREGGRLAQTRGRPGWPKILQPLFSSSCTQRTPAGLPFGMPGIADEIDGAMQQAPQPGRQLANSEKELTGTVRK
jgi:hypothetical protein